MLRTGVELIVVFVGVWLSLLAENWRQNQSDARTARSSMSRMAEDLESDLLDFGLNRDRAETGVVLGRWLLTRGVTSEAPEDSISRALTALQFCSYLLENTAEYEALLNSGQLGIISDRDLRRTVVAQYESRQIIRMLHVADCESEALLFGLMASDVLVSESPARGEVGPYGFADPLRPRVMAVPGRANLLTDPGFLSHVTRLVSFRRFLVRQIDEQIETTTALREELLERVR